MPYDGAAIPEHNPVGDLPRGGAIVNENLTIQTSSSSTSSSHYYGC